MDSQSAVDLGRQAILQCVVIGGPILSVLLVVGLIIAVVQTVTNVHDYSVAFIPKLVVVMIGVAVCLPWMMNKLSDYSRAALSNVPTASRIDR